jgi:hypothetical protein
MTCPLCDGVGLIAIGADAPPDGTGGVAICLCRPGLNLRVQIARGLYALLAATYHVSIDQVGLVEEFLDATDIPPALRPNTRHAGIEDAGARSGKAKL